MSTDGIHMPYRVRSPQQIVWEIIESGEKYVVFTDNNLGSNKKYLMDLCRALKPLDIMWSAAVSIDVTDDPTLVRAMGTAGCMGVFVGFESLTDENLETAGKRTPKTCHYADRVKLFHQNGIQVNGSFVFGFDGDKKDVFSKTVEWVEENKLECSTFHILTPYPGTPLFKRLEKEGRIIHKNWNLYDTAHTVFIPKNMTPGELEQGYAWAYKRLFSHTSIWRRRPSDLKAVAPYLAMSYLYKKSNWLWHNLIRTNMTRAVWSPLIELTRRRHLRLRKKIALQPIRGQNMATGKLSGASMAPT